MSFQASLVDSQGNPLSVSSADGTTINITDSSNYLSSNGNRFLFSDNDFRYILVTQPDGSQYVLCTNAPYSQQIPYVNQQLSNPQNTFSIPNTVGDGQYEITLATIPQYFVSGGGNVYNPGFVATDSSYNLFQCIQSDPATSISQIYNTAYWQPVTLANIIATGGFQQLGYQFIATVTIFIVSNLLENYFAAAYAAVTYEGFGIDNITDPDKNKKLKKAMILLNLYETISDAVNKNNWMEAQAMLNYAITLYSE